MKEASFRAIILGSLIGIIFGCAMAFIGLKIGMTISASIPAAVISMAILRGLLKTGTTLENNIVQTIASSGESLAAGIIFTMPAFFLLTGKFPTVMEIVFLSILGGVLGIIFMIPFRKEFIEEEEKVLPFPEGKACAEVLIAGEEGGRRAKFVFLGVIFGGVYKVLMSVFQLWKEVATFPVKFLKTAFSVDISPALLGVGFIIGPRISLIVFAGGFLGWFILIPLISYYGGSLNYPVYPAKVLISQMSPSDIWSNYIRYIGAGGVVIGGFFSLFQTLYGLIRAMKKRRSEQAQKTTPKLSKDSDVKGERNNKRSLEDLPLSVVIIGTIIVVLALWFWLGISSIKSLVVITLVVILGFFFVLVASRAVGLVGSSSSPVSGMTLTAILISGLIFVAFGWKGTDGVFAVLTVGAVVCIAICSAGDIAQDLKTGYLVGAKPYKQQLMEFVGILAPVFFIAFTLIYLHKMYGIGVPKSAEHPNPLIAPQANIIAMVINGIMQQSLPLKFFVSGIIIGIIVEILGIPSLPFAIGLYLPFSLSVPILIGGIMYFILEKTSSNEDFKLKQDNGILVSSGLVAGDALLGIIIAFLASVTIAGKTIQEIVKLRSISSFTLSDVIGVRFLNFISLEDLIASFSFFLLFVMVYRIISVSVRK